MYPKSNNDSRHYVQHFCISGSWYIAIVVTKNSIEQRRHEINIDSIEIFRFLDICLHKLQDFFLYRP